ncbi:hypothetical protein [Vibrio sp. R78045]|uniref:hypothetical protein n=1 Tax=Vibrio sp. R78045 TaxID=3093868 RepID=UPI0036F25D5D
MVTLEELQTHGGAIISLVRPLPEHELMIGIQAHNLLVRHKLSEIKFEHSEMRSQEYILSLTNAEKKEIKGWVVKHSSCQLT